MSKTLLSSTLSGGPHGLGKHPFLKSNFGVRFSLHTFYRGSRRFIPTQSGKGNPHPQENARFSPRREMRRRSSTLHRVLQKQQCPNGAFVPSRKCWLEEVPECLVR